MYIWKRQKYCEILMSEFLLFFFFLNKLSECVFLTTEGKGGQQTSLEHFSKSDKITPWLRSVQNTRCFLPVGNICNCFLVVHSELSMFGEFLTQHLSLSKRQGLSSTIDPKKASQPFFFFRPRFSQWDAADPEFDPKHCKTGESILVLMFNFPKALGTEHHPSCRVCGGRG